MCCGNACVSNGTLFNALSEAPRWFESKLDAKKMWKSVWGLETREVVKDEMCQIVWERREMGEKKRRSGKESVSQTQFQSTTNTETRLPLKDRVIRIRMMTSN